MLKLKFLKLFRTLKKEEVAGFEKHLRSIHAKEQVAHDVFNYIRKFYPDFDDEKKLNLDYAYPKIFSAETEPNRKKILNALSDLTLWLRDFLVLEKVTGRSFEAQFFLTRILRERDIEEEYKKSAVELGDIVKNTVKSSIFDYMNSMIANHHFYFYFNKNKSEENGSLLQQCNDDLDIAYAVSKLKLACEMAAYNNVFSPDNKLETLPLPMELVQKYAADVPLLRLYLSLYQLIVIKEDVFYDMAESVLLEHGPTFDKIELHSALVHMRSFSAQKIRAGDEQEAFKKAHNLNKMSYDSGFIQKEKMDPIQFTNIVNVACFVNDFEWAGMFITASSHLLGKKIRADTILLAEAIICSAQKDAEGTLLRLEQTNFKDMLLNIRARSLMLKSYYELNEPSERILSYCTAFNSYLSRRQKLYKPTVRSIRNFIKMVKMLVKNKKDILSAIDNTKPLSFKKWLLEMANK